MTIKYEKLPAFLGDGLKATYKGVRSAIFEYDDYVFIQAIESRNPNKGEVKEFLSLLKKKYPVIKSSVSLSDRWKRICELNSIEII